MPKKDECKTCTSFANASPELQKQLEESQQQHLKNKNRAREEKAKDKERAFIDPSFSSITMDLQQVLSTPSSTTSVLFYKRKLSYYNFTIYDQGSGDGTCFIWPETMGARGSCEIGTCIIKHLLALPNSVKHVTMFSDTCGGQNRNQYLSAGLLHVVRTSSVSIIEQKFLESGHSQMEADAMHSSIEHAKKKVPIFHPDQWVTLA